MTDAFAIPPRAARVIERGKWSSTATDRRAVLDACVLPVVGFWAPQAYFALAKFSRGDFTL
jgi:hypothetical protein